MKKQDLEAVRQRLLVLASRLRKEAKAVLEEALAPTTGVRGGELSNAPFHLADSGTEEFLSMMNAALMENELQLATNVRDALRRIDNGTYGICVDCGAPISNERLMALPFVSRCIKCAEQAESVGAASAPNVNRGRPAGPADTLAPEGEMLESRQGGTTHRDRADLPFAHDEHAAGTPGGGTSLGGLAGTNIGHGDPTIGDLDDASGSSESERSDS
jgi:RNA polymerase-binding transcription factor DksA